MVNHKIVPDEPLGSLTTLVPIPLFPLLLATIRLKSVFRARERPRCRGWKSVFYVIPFTSLTLVYATKGAPHNSPAFGLRLFPPLQIYRELPRICVNYFFGNRVFCQTHKSKTIASYRKIKIKVLINIPFYRTSRSLHQLILWCTKIYWREEEERYIKKNYYI